MADSNYKRSMVVMRKRINDGEASDMIEEKKTGPFRVLLKKPDKNDVNVHSVTLNYESILMMSGRYTADFYRKAVHPINVDYNVTEVVLGDGVFQIQQKPNWKKVISSKKAKNRVDLVLDEHVFIDDEYVLFFDHHGVQVDFDYKLDPKNMENYPERVLRGDGIVIKKPNLTDKQAIDLFNSKIVRPSGSEIRDLNEKVTINKILEIYVPIYEARLAGPKKKVEILRLDAARAKIL